MADTAHIVFSPEMADGFVNDSGPFDGPGRDTPIAKALVTDRLKVRAITDEEEDPVYIENSNNYYPNDHTITLTELRRAFYANQSLTGNDARAHAAAEHVFSTFMKGQAEGDNTINTNAEAERFLQILTSETAHLISGGTVIYDRIDVEEDQKQENKKSVTVELRKPGFKLETLKAQLIPFDLPKFLEDAEFSCVIDVDKPEQYFVTVIYPKAPLIGIRLGGNMARWVTVTRHRFTSEDSGTFGSDWTRVPEKEAAQLLRANKKILTEAMKRLEVDQDPEEYLNGLIEELDSVSKVAGSNTYANPVYRYNQAASPSVEPPRGQTLAAAFKTALHNLADREGVKELPIILRKYNKKGELVSRQHTMMKPAN